MSWTQYNKCCIRCCCFFLTILLAQLSTHSLGIFPCSSGTRMIFSSVLPPAQKKRKLERSRYAGLSQVFRLYPTPIARHGSKRCSRCSERNPSADTAKVFFFAFGELFCWLGKAREPLFYSQSCFHSFTLLCLKTRAKASWLLSAKFELHVHYGKDKQLYSAVVCVNVDKKEFSWKTFRFIGMHSTKT